MKQKYVLFFLFFIILCSFSILDVFYKKTYIYNDITGNLRYKTVWLLKKKKDNFVIDKRAENTSTNLIYSPSFILEKYTFISPKENINFTLILENKTILAEGINKGIKIYKKIEVNKDWIQDFNFGLKQFLNSKLLEKKFMIVNVKDFSIYEMIAYKKDIQKIDINKKTYKTQKVEITLPGFKSHFWKAQIWYDLNTLDLIQYKANEGPGTPVNIILLDSVDENVFK